MKTIKTYIELFFIIIFSLLVPVTIVYAVTYENYSLLIVSFISAILAGLFFTLSND